MSELIDRQALLDEIWKMRMNYQMMDDTHTADKIMHGLYRAEQAVKEAPTIAATRWVRVEDGLPKPIHPSDPNYMPYLICDSLGYMYVADYTYGKYSTAYSFHVDGEEVTDVIYLMPIEPPKEDE